MSTGTLWARIRRGVEDKNIGYARNRRHTPFGSATSSDQFAAGAEVVGTSSMNSAAAARPSRRRQRWKLLKATLSRRTS